MKERTTTEIYLAIIEEGKTIAREKERKLKEEQLQRAVNKSLLDYTTRVFAKIDELIKPDMVCAYLMEEKELCIKNHVKHLNLGNTNNAKLNQRALDETIAPLLNLWQAKGSTEIKSDIEKDKNQFQEEKIPEISTEKENIPSTNLNANLTELPADFEQIDCSASKKEILDFFMILAKEKNKSNGKSYMKKEDVLEFVKKNFSVFKTDATHMYFPLNLETKATLVYFIYEFYRKYDYSEKNSKMKYVKLLINNFLLFKTEVPKTLLSNMSESKKPVNANTIPTHKYLPKASGFKKH